MSGYGCEKDPPGGLFPEMDRQEMNPEEALAKFRKAEYGDRMMLPLRFIRPSQVDDGTRNYSTDPVDVFEENGELRIDTGNHRYYTRVAQGESDINARKIKNPYVNW